MTFGIPTFPVLYRVSLRHSVMGVVLEVQYGEGIYSQAHTVRTPETWLGLTQNVDVWG